LLILIVGDDGLTYYNEYGKSIVIIKNFKKEINFESFFGSG
jgi:hypothetical protein